MSKIVLIGANHAGTAAANTILDHYPENQLTIFDSNSNISYLGCGTALWVGRQINNPDGLFYCSKDVFVSKHAAVYMETEVTRIDFNEKLVYATEKNGNTITEPYDKLILATGSRPVTPDIPGIDLKGVEYVKLFQDGQKIDRALGDPSIKNVAVIGAGYIGVEIAEAVHRRGKKTMLFETADTCLSGYYDEWFSYDMDRVLESNGIELHYGEKVEQIKPDMTGLSRSGYPDSKDKVGYIVTNKGEYQADMVILAMGFRPCTDLGRCNLASMPNGAYQVNLNQETNVPDVYAIGDCASVYSNALQSSAYIALATNAVRSGIVAGNNVCGNPLKSIGVQGSNGISIFGYKMVSTGLNMKAAQKAGFHPVYTEFEDLQKPAFIEENNNKVKLRIVYDERTRRVLGAQMASWQDISMGIHMFSLAIEENVTIDKLKLLDIFFLPHFNQPYNYITMAALSAK
ncbi:MAG: FAD-dependent oxidoreductase [Hungatella sp.]|nr:FAD-dependent oxidoreductase [Hungatella sp.]